MRALLVGLLVLLVSVELLAAGDPSSSLAAYPAPSASPIGTQRARLFLPLADTGQRDTPTVAPTPTLVPATATAPPTATNVPTATATNVPTAIRTAVPTFTATTIATSTSTPRATNTALPTPTATPNPRVNAVFVFVKGLRSSSSDTAFEDFKSALIGLGYTYGQMVDYSYTGTYRYECSDTFQSFDTSSYYLRILIADIRAVNPSARVVLIGHSLGGLLAMEQLYENPSSIAGVETIDAPLQGVGSGKLLIGDVGHCFNTTARAAQYTYPIIDYLDQLHTSASYYAQFWRTVGQHALAQGVSVWTVGNANDCLYYPPLCGAIGFYSDDRLTQVTDGLGTWYSTPILSAWLSALPWTGIGSTHGGLLKASNGYLSTLAAFADRAARTQ